MGAERGQRVKITLSESAVVKASAILYLLPAVSLLAGAILGSTFFQGMKMSSDSGAMLGAAVGVALGFTASYFFSKRAEKSRQSVPVISAIVSGETL